MGLLGQIIEGFKRNSRRSEIRKGTMIQLGLCSPPVDVTYSNRKPEALWEAFHLVTCNLAEIDRTAIY